MYHFYMYTHRYTSINNLRKNTLMCMVACIICHLMVHYYKTERKSFAFSHLAKHHNV